jgi:hypothetical protein
MSQKAPESQTQWEHQREDLLLAIDQLSQMTEVMNDVLRRVRQQVDGLDNHRQANKKDPTLVEYNTTKKTGTNNKNNNKKVNKIDLVH